MHLTKLFLLLSTGSCHAGKNYEEGGSQTMGRDWSIRKQSIQAVKAVKDYVRSGENVEEKLRSIGSTQKTALVSSVTADPTLK